MTTCLIILLTLKGLHMQILRYWKFTQLEMCLDLSGYWKLTRIHVALHLAIEGSYNHRKVSNNNF